MYPFLCHLFYLRHILITTLRLDACAMSPFVYVNDKGKVCSNSCTPTTPVSVVGVKSTQKERHVRKSPPTIGLIVQTIRERKELLKRNFFYSKKP